MRQVLFTIPDPFGFFPNGVPVYGFGAMLFLAFVVCIWFLGKRGQQQGIAKERLQDMAFFLFVVGLIGARIVYAIQYNLTFTQFFWIWEGGIVFYGSIIGGTIGYIFFYQLVLKKQNISTWQVGDIIAPTLCIGLAIGRVGCFLNGCCYGQVACESCPSLEFPLLTAPCREMLVEKSTYQTTVGFSLSDIKDETDIRSVIGQVEYGSAAQRSGLKPGDKIIQVNDQPNHAVLLLSGPKENIDGVIRWAKGQGFRIVPLDSGNTAEGTFKMYVSDVGQFSKIKQEALQRLQALPRTYSTDTFGDLLSNWPRGKESLSLVVERDGQEVTIPSFTPRGLGLHPTQIYETISMALLLFLLLSYFPYRRHNGQLFVLWMVGYSIHRFLNEILRNDTPVEGFNMTLSQNISVVILASALILELYLRYTQPSRWARNP